MSFAPRRVEYETAGLDRADLAGDPITQWHHWYENATSAKVTEPNAMTVATVDSQGVPDARVVLVQEVDENGFVFYTNYDSVKSMQLLVHPVASAVFAWLDLHRQVRLRGTVKRVSAQQSDKYFDSRPRESQLGAWASQQSQVIANRGVIEARLALMRDKFVDQIVPRPEFWGGWSIIPTEIEFWQGRPSRLHDRFRYTKQDSNWQLERLAP